ncbi:hypothetical protein HT031_003978 [Scenedesmus sp. PABB004]|nr:hypothetical protein HT031_003978 [Scenedesmus sp. PABB004]
MAGGEGAPPPPPQPDAAAAAPSPPPPQPPPQPPAGATEPGSPGAGRAPRASGGSLASKIAAFASGVAPVRQGLANAGEDAMSVEDVLHKLEGAARTPGGGPASLPVPLVRGAYEALVAAREDAGALSRELAELRSSRVQLIPPSAWVKRETKYKMDLEKYEHTIAMQAQRVERLERELQVLREGSNVKPLEQRIEELEHQLSAAAEEKTAVQSKYHELSIKHRQLIETSPQVATIWNEVLVQQAAAHGDAAALARLQNFDLRHTGAHGGLGNGAPGGGGGGGGAPAAAAAPGAVSPRKLVGVSAAAAIFSGQGPPPVPSAAAAAAATGSGGSSGSPAPGGGPGPPGGGGPAAAPPGAGRGAPAPAPAAPASAEERAAALMAAVALEGLSPEASIAALQQLNYDVTMQLGCYQQMVGRLKDALEQSDLEKAELEADRTALLAQLTAHGGEPLPGAGGGAHAGGGGGGSARGGGRWGLFWRRGGGEEGEGEGGSADMASLGSSRRSSADLDGSPLSAAARAASAHAGGAGDEQQHDAAARALRRTSSTGGGAGGGGADVAPEAPSPTAARTGSGVAAGLFGARRARAAARDANTLAALGKEVKELRRQLAGLSDENRFLVQSLVEIKMELAETQGSHDQAKRALVRAMDKEELLDLRVTELAHMLDLATQQQAASANAKAIAAAGAAVAGAAAAALEGGRAAASRLGRRAGSGGRGGGASEGLSEAPEDGGGAGEAPNDVGGADSGGDSDGADSGSADSGSDSGAGADEAPARVATHAVDAGSSSGGGSSSGESYDSTLSSSAAGGGPADEAPALQAGEAEESPPAAPRAAAASPPPERDIGGYTPAEYISWSDDPTRQCHHAAEVVVDAPIGAAFALWADWARLIEFMDLVGQIGLDPDTPDMALFQCFYRWRKLPMMEIIFLLERTCVEPDARITFESATGMPIKGEVRLQEQADGRTRVALAFSHPVPNLLVQLQVGPFGLETDLLRILRENLETYRRLAEAAAPPDWPAARAAAAARGAAREAAEAAEAAAAQRERRAAPAAARRPAAQQRQPPPPQQQQQQQEQEQEQEQQQQQPVREQQPQQPPVPAARKQRTSRRTAAADLFAPEEPAAAAGRPRSRGASGRRTAAAAPGAEPGAAGGAGQRRSRGSTAARSAGGDGGDGGNGTSSGAGGSGDATAQPGAAPGGAMSAAPAGKPRAGPTTRARAAPAAAAGEAPGGNEAAPSPWTDLPEPLVLHVLSFLPPAVQAWRAELVCKAAHERFRGARRVSLRCPELPLAAVQEAWRAVQGDGWKQQDKRQQLASARAACGDVAGLAWLRAAGCSMVSMVGSAARAGQLAVLEWACSEGLDLGGVCMAATDGGQLAVLRWARAQAPPLPWGDYVCTIAALRCNLEVLRWARAQAEPAPWSEETCVVAAGRGQLDALRWLRANGCPWLRVGCERAAAREGHAAVAAGTTRVGRLTAGLTRPAQRQASRARGQAAHTIDAMSSSPAELSLAGLSLGPAAAAPAGGEGPSEEAASEAALLQLPEPLVLHVLSLWPPSLQAWCARLVCKAARERFRRAMVVSAACPELPLAAVQEAWRAVRGHERQQWRLAEARAACGDVAGLAWLRGAGCDTRYVCWAAARAGQIAVLEWARREGLRLQGVCARAAKGGQLAALRWARAQVPPAPWNNWVCYEAASRGDLEMLCWRPPPPAARPWPGGATRVGRLTAGPTRPAQRQSTAMERLTLFQRPWCNEQLEWQLIGSPSDRGKAPDVVFCDPTFSPLAPGGAGAGGARLAELLDAWTGPECLPALLDELLRLYAEHQKAKVAALGDERMLFELAMLDDLGCTEVAQAGSFDGSFQQACFSIPLAADLGPAARLRDHAAPDLSLASPPWAAAHLPPLALPAWDPQSSLVEFVPAAAERLGKHLSDHCPPAALRFELLAALGGALGAPLETVARAPPPRPGGASSAGASAGGARGGGGGRAASTALFQVACEAQPLLLHVELSPGFPADAPVLVLQSARRQGPDSTTTLAGVPWSPRWPVDEMAPAGAMSSAPAGKRRAGPTTRARAAAAASADEAPGGDEAAPSPLPELPQPLVLHVLSFLPPALHAWTAKLVCKAAHERFRGATVVSLRCPELPLAAVQEAWRAVQGGGERQQIRLAGARAACGDVAGLAWLRGAGCDMGGVAWAAAEHGQLAVLEWARDQGLDLEAVCVAAAKGGQLAVLRWARAQAEPPPWGDLPCFIAAIRGQLDALRWLRANGCTWSRDLCESVAADEAVVALSDGAMSAASTGKRRAGPTTRARAAAEAAAAAGEAPGGAEAAASAASSPWTDLPEPLVLHALSFLPPALQAWRAKLVCKAARERFQGATVVSLRCPELPLAAVQEAWRAVQGDGEVTRARAACGDVSGLAWLRGAGCSMDSGVGWEAAKHGQLAVLEWARGAGLNLQLVCAGAALGGQMAVLRWARAQDEPAPWDHLSCFAAAWKGHLEALCWLRANGCPWRRGVCERGAAREGHEAVVAWIRAQPAAADDQPGWG